MSIFTAIRNVLSLGSIDLTTLKERMTKMSEQLNTLVDRVAEIETVADSAIELITSLKAELDTIIGGGCDPAALQELADRLGAQTQALADAVSANTPVDPEPPVDPIDPIDPEDPMV